MNWKFNGEKKKVYIGIGAAGLVITGLMFGADMLMGPPKEKGEEINGSNITIVDKKLIDQVGFKAQYGEKIKELEAKNGNLEKQMTNQGESVREIVKEELEVYAKDMAQPQQQQMPQLPQIQSGPQQNIAPMSVPPIPESEPVRQFNDLIAVETNDKYRSEASAEINIQTKKAKKVVIEAGTFVEGRFLQTVNAPTGGKALTDPLPVLIQITKFANQTNKYKADIRNCRVLGAAWGDLSSETIKVRAEKLSCHTEDGIGFSKDIVGYGNSDAEIISKNGAMLARAMAAGFLEGVSKAFTQAGTNYQVSSLGTVASPADPNNITAGGLFGGAGEATKRLADFYMKMNSEIYPVAVVYAGRKIDITFTNDIVFEE